MLARRMGKVASAMGAQEVQERLARIARADIGEHLSFDAEGQPKLQLSQDNTGTIREYVEEREVTRKAGETEVSTTVRRIKVADPLPALQTLAKIHGLEKDGSNPPQNNTLVLAGLDPEILRALLRHAIGNAGHAPAIEVEASAG